MNEDYANYKNREFICACGKNYLSYAALFTHIKQKHEGKAPGPIIRPRSQRKRGRPRKNPHVENQSSDLQEEQIQNGILKGIDNNNNNNNSHIQKEEKQQKTKKAAELLGCGGFAAFTAYKPDISNSTLKKQHDSNKKSFVKKASMEVLQRKCSNSFNPIIGTVQQISSIVHIPTEEFKVQMVNFCQNISNLNKLQLKKIFEGKNEDFSDLQTKLKELKVYKQLNRNEQHQFANLDISSASITCIIDQFLKQTKCLLYREHQTKVQQSGSSIEAQQSNCHNYEQAFLLTALLLQEFINQYNLQTTHLAEKSINQLQNYIQKFISKAMPLRIQQMKIQNYSLFKGLNSIKFMIYLSNWIVLKKAEYELGKPTLKQEDSNHLEQSMDQQQGLQKQKQNDSLSHDQLSDNHEQFIVGENANTEQKMNHS